MTTIKRFTPDYKMHAVRFEAFAREAEHGEYVKFDAHQRAVSALEAERDEQQKRADALEVRLRNALISEQEAIQRAHAANQTADALAVENAALKSAITGKAYIDFVTSNGWNPGMKTINGKFAGFMDSEIDFGCMAYDHAKKLIDAVETPATSAALAAIQAQGVEKFADFLDSPIDGQHCYQHEVGLARHFASTLREAK